MKTIIKLIFLLLGINSSIISAQTNFNQGIRLENGSDLNFQGYSVNQLDAGDIIFSKYTNQEMARIRSEYYGANNGASIIFSTTPLIKDTFTFSSTGNLGIGISNPQAGVDILRSYDLNIPRAIKIMYQGSWGTPQYANNYRFIDIQSTEEGNILAVNAYGMGIGFNPPSYSSPDKLYINGNVGIGTTSPISKLDVVGRTNISGLGNSAPILGSLIGGFNISAGSSNTSYGIQSGFYNIGTYWIQSQTNDGSTIAYDISLNPLGGNVGIGITNPANKLDVNGTIHSKEVKVDMLGWPDYVFKKEYDLPTLEEVEKHINEKGHLENIPSEEEVLKNGINLGEMNTKLLQKIEEMTLYIIEQNKKINQQNERIISLEKRLDKIN